MNIVTTDEWNMPQLGASHANRSVTVITEANVHHSDSTPATNHATCASTVRGFDSYHRSKGWAGIGYNRVICPHGSVFLGRPLGVVPAAAENHNTPIVSYCIIAKNGPATDEQWAALLEMAAHDAATIGHPLTWTTHREVEPPGYTECPGDKIEAQVVAQRRHHGKVQPGVDHSKGNAPKWFTRVLRYTPGKPLLHGQDVKAVQERLHFAGKSIDGYYGPITTRAVKAAQSHFHLAADGVVGKATARALNR